MHYIKSPNWYENVNVEWPEVIKFNWSVEFIETLLPTFGIVEISSEIKVSKK